MTSNDPRQDVPPNDLPVVIYVLREQVAAVGRFVDAFADVDPMDTSPEERGRLLRVRDLMDDVLSPFS